MTDHGHESGRGQSITSKSQSRIALKIIYYVLRIYTYAWGRSQFSHVKPTCPRGAHGYWNENPLREGIQFKTMHIVGEDTLTQTTCKLSIRNDRVVWHRVAVSVHVHIRFFPPMIVQLWDDANVKTYNGSYTARWITSRMKVFGYMRIGRRDNIINLPHPHMWCLPNVLASYVSNRSMCFQEQGKRFHCFPDWTQFAISYHTQ